MFIRLRDRNRVMRGVFELEIWKGGKLIERYEDKNLIVNGAKSQLARLISGDFTGRNISHIGFGIGTATPTPDNVSLQGALWLPISSVSYPSTGEAQFNWSLSTTQANGMHITEFGLRCADGTLFARKKRNGRIDKDSDIGLAGRWTIVF